MKPFRDGKHFLSRTRPGVKGEEVDIVKMRLAYDEICLEFDLLDPGQGLREEGRILHLQFASANVRERFKVIQAKLGQSSLLPSKTLRCSKLSKDFFSCNMYVFSNKQLSLSLKMIIKNAC